MKQLTENHDILEDDNKAHAVTVCSKCCPRKSRKLATPRYCKSVIFVDDCVHDFVDCGHFATCYK